MKTVFLCAAVLWLVLNVVTLTAYPAVWVDEILLADPGMHLALGKGFVSTAWFNQPSWEFWAGYTPLYSFVLAGWLKLFGISAFAVRSFGLALVVASLAMVWRCLNGIVESSIRWTIVLALAVCEPIAFLERAGRADSVSLFLLTATALVVMEKQWRWRSSLLLILGALAVASALQYTAFMVVLAVLVHLWFKPFGRRDLVMWGTGVVSGATLLALIYGAHGVLKVFIEVTLISKHSTVGRLLQNVFLRHGAAPLVLSDIANSWFRDYATPILILGGIVIWWFAKQQDHSLARQFSSFGVACAVLIPLSIQLLGKYPVYYAYMGATPAAVAILAAGGLLHPRTRFINSAILAFLLIGGIGRLWWRSWNQGAQTIVNLDKHVSTQETVVADYPAYYQLIGRTRELFAVGYGGGKLMPHLPPEQAVRVTKLIVRDSKFPEVAGKVGGDWQRTDDVVVTRHGTFTHSVIIDDDTRNPEEEPMGIYTRKPIKP